MSVSSFGKPPPDMFEVIYGSPRVRSLRQTCASYETRPHLPLGPVQGTLHWYFTPFKLHLRVQRALRAVAVLFSAGAVLGFAALVPRTGVGATALLLLVHLFVVSPILYLAHLVLFNYRLREGVCWCLGKAAQAKQQWQELPIASKPGSTSSTSVTRTMAKQVFFIWNVTKRFQLVVLNDGTQEVWNTTGDELHDGLAQSLGLAGFVGAGRDSITGLPVGQVIAEKNANHRNHSHTGDFENTEKEIAHSPLDAQLVQPQENNAIAIGTASTTIVANVTSSDNNV